MIALACNLRKVGEKRMRYVHMCMHVDHVNLIIDHVTTNVDHVTMHGDYMTHACGSCNHGRLSSKFTYIII